MNNTDNKLMPPRELSADGRITAALEQKPELQIPADFAAKVAARAAAQPLHRRRPTPRFGRLIALLSVPLAAIALFALAPHAAPNLYNLSFDAELALLAELAFIGWWLSRTFQSQTFR
jgi:hypothetical protein